MIRASIAHTKNHLSALLKQVRSGETVLITDRDKPVARLVPVQEFDLDARIVEMARMGLVTLPTRPPLAPGELRPVPLEGGGYAGALDALLEEREEGW